MVCEIEEQYRNQFAKTGLLSAVYNAEIVK
jgi:hypothetical protein